MSDNRLGLPRELDDAHSSPSPGSAQDEVLISDESGKSKIHPAFRAGLVAIVLMTIAGLVIFQGRSKVPTKAIERSGQESISTPSAGTGNVDADIAHLESLWNAHGTHSPIAMQLGLLYSKKGDHLKAVEYFQKFLEIDTSITREEARLDLAKELFALGRIEEAKTQMVTLLKTDPNNPGALYNLGAIEANLGKFDNARNYWEQLIRTQPGDSLAVVARTNLRSIESK